MLSTVKIRFNLGEGLATLFLCASLTLTFVPFHTWTSCLSPLPFPWMCCENFKFYLSTFHPFPIIFPLKFTVITICDDFEIINFPPLNFHHTVQMLFSEENRFKNFVLLNWLPFGDLAIMTHYAKAHKARLPKLSLYSCNFLNYYYYY